MAFSGKTLGRATSSGQTSSLIDGVQVKVVDNFHPPKKVTLPMNFELGNPTEVLFMEYDFNLEERVLEWTASQRQAVKALDQAETRQVGEAIEQFMQVGTSTSQNTDETPEDDPMLGENEIPADLESNTNKVSTLNISNDVGASSAEEVPNSAQDGNNTNVSEVQDEKSATDLKEVKPAVPFFQSMNSSILVPTPITASKTANTAQIAPKSNFNVADFERESDPFDNLELETLNEMEELNKVLSGAQVPQQPSRPTAHSSVSAQTVGTSAPNQTVAAQSPCMLTGTQGSYPVQSSNFIASGMTNLKNVHYPDFDSMGATSHSVSTSAQYTHTQAGQVTNPFYSSNAVGAPSSLTQGPNLSSSTVTTNSFLSGPLPPIPNSRYMVQQQQQQPNPFQSQHHQTLQQSSQNSAQPAAVTMNFLQNSATFSTKALKDGSEGTTTNSSVPCNQYSRHSISYHRNGYIGQPGNVSNKNGCTSRPESPITTGYGLRSARSTPDISELLQSDKRGQSSVAMPTSHTPPPYPTRGRSPPPRPSSGQIDSEVPTHKLYSPAVLSDLLMFN